MYLDIDKREGVTMEYLTAGPCKKFFLQQMKGRNNYNKKYMHQAQVR